MAPEPQPPEIPEIIITEQSQKFQNGATWNIQKGLSGDGREWVRSIQTKKIKVSETGTKDKYRLVGEKTGGFEDEHSGPTRTNTTEWRQV